ncbi:MAG: polysaccharide biosynthesis protein [Monoglobaceae bacterium]
MTGKMPDIGSFAGGKSVLITGGGGTIGRELCRAVSFYSPGKIIVADIYENNAYMIYRELYEAGFTDIEVEILSVCSEPALRRLFERHRPDIVYHAAAHKHVPLMEKNVSEAVLNNVFGTENVLRMAVEYCAKKAILISTDKAINPVGVMGATKRAAEMLAVLADRKNKTAISVVRFGNVFGSDGSVIPIFEKQIDGGGPITVTDKRCVRYFMSVTEAVNLLLAAGSISKGGEIFALDMGEPRNIYELACDMIRSRGLTPNKDIDIICTGMRNGERLHEENTVDFSAAKPTSAERVYITADVPFDAEVFEARLAELKRLALDINDSAARRLLFEIIGQPL